MKLRKNFTPSFVDASDDSPHNSEDTGQTVSSPMLGKEAAVERKENDGDSEALNSTVSRRTEEKEEEEYIGHLAAIVMSTDDAIISKSLDGIIKSWNKGSEKMFGYTENQAIGKHISLILPPNHVDEEKNIVERIRNNEIINHYETVRIRKGGDKFHVSLTVSPLKDRTGKIVGISKIARDITIQKEIMTALIKANKDLVFQNQEREKRAEELIITKEEHAYQNDENESRASTMNITNRELTSLNTEIEKRAAEMIIANQELAFQNEEKEKRAAELILANKELAFQNNEKEKIAAELIIANQELVYQNEEKEQRAAELAIANVELTFQNQEKEKRANELMLTLIDLENAKNNIRLLNDELEQKVLERTEQMQSANKELESFSYSVSHDLRAPLRAVHGYAKMLKRSSTAKLDTEENRLMNNILNNAKKMGQLIDELLTFSRLGRKELIKTEIPMQNMVTNICDELKIEPGNSKIEIIIDHLMTAYGDITTIKQVWLNLISNAVKYSRLKDKAIIEIGSEIKDDEIIFHIKDNGAGFDMRYADKLFEVFQRLHTDQEFEGIGVGLAIVHRIVTKHGGRVWAEGKVDEGAIFYFTLKK